MDATTAPSCCKISDGARGAGPHRTGALAGADFGWIRSLLSSSPAWLTPLGDRGEAFVKVLDG